MTSPYIKALEILDECESTTSRTAKEELLQSAIDEVHAPTLKTIFTYSLNPYYNYYTHAEDFEHLPYSRPKHHDDKMFMRMFEILDDLRLRHITGNSAIRTVAQLIKALPDDYHRKWFSRIINQDLRCGISVKTVNKIFKDLIPTFAIQLCDKYDSQDMIGWYAEPKYNGNRCITIINENGSIAMFSRAGKAVNNVDHIIEDLHVLKLKNIVFDGELYSDVAGSKENADWSKTTSIIHTESLHADRESLKYWVFDQVSLLDWESRRSLTSLADRKDILSIMKFSTASSLRIVPRKVIKQSIDVIKITDMYIADGFEGSVIKDPKSTYDFKRSKSWVKVKKFIDGDFEILRVEIGTGRNKDRLGALVVDVNGVEVSIGSGYSDSQRENMWNNRKKLISKIIEVTYQQITKDGSLLFPVFIRLRNDK
jgi:DNA ligase-1